MLSPSYSSPDEGNEQSPTQPLTEGSPAEKRSLRATEVAYAVFALAVGILLFATAV